MALVVPLGFFLKNCEVSSSKVLNFLAVIDKVRLIRTSLRPHNVPHVLLMLVLDLVRHSQCGTVNEDHLRIDVQL